MSDSGIWFEGCYMYMETFKKLNEVRHLLPPVFEVSEIARFFPEKSAPRKFCERLVAQGVLLRLKKGVYAFCEVHALVVANYLAPCSYVSFETALSHYGMIPEFTPLIMSVSSVSRHRTYVTAIGSYEYFHQHSELFATGMDRLSIGENTPLLIATPEKALCDALARRGEQYHNKDVDFMGALIDGLRIEDDTLKNLDYDHIKSLGNLYTSRAPKLLYSYLMERFGK
jgi:predicted transcriptional regulator of viral defense system